MNWTKLFGFIRHLLTFGGGYMVAKGYFDEATMNELVGAVMSIIGAVWSWQSPEKAPE
jgi:hypothetical protein